MARQEREHARLAQPLATSQGRPEHRSLAKRGYLTERQKESLLGYLMMAPWLVGFLAFVAGPMIISMVISLFNTNLFSRTIFIGLRNFVEASEDPLVLKSLVNTAYYSFAMVPLGTALALFLALLLNQDIKGRSVFRALYYVPSIVSGVVVSILWAWLYHPDQGLINSILGLFGLWRILDPPRWIYSETLAMPSLILMSLWGTGGSMLIFLAGLQGIPTALYEAAQIDGANSWRRFWNITLPMLTPTIFFSIIMRIIGSFQVFTQAFIMTKGGPNNATLTMVLYLYRKAFQQFRFGYASVLAWILFLVIMVFTLSVIRSSAIWVYYEAEVKG
jgi:multiple sugar transport system permease protein